MRPSPVCTSSMTSSAPRSRASARYAGHVAGLGRRKAERGRDRLEDDRGGVAPDRCTHRLDVVVRHADDSGRLVAERLDPAPVSGRPAEARVAVVAADHRDDPRAVPDRPRESQREVDGLAAGRSEDGVREQFTRRLGEPLGEPRPPAADQMVVADVDVVERLAQRADHAGVAVAEVEDAAVAVAVPVPAAAEGILEPGPLPLADHNVDAERLEHRRLAAVHVGCESLGRCGPVGVVLLQLTVSRGHSAPKRPTPGSRRQPWAIRSRRPAI